MSAQSRHPGAPGDHITPYDRMALPEEALSWSRNMSFV